MNTSHLCPFCNTIASVTRLFGELVLYSKFGKLKFQALDVSRNSKTDAEEEVKREISCVQVYQGENGPSKLRKRNRKRKSYGKEFEHDESEEALDATDDKAPCLYFPMPEKSKIPDQNTKKVTKKKKKTSTKKDELLSIPRLRTL
ncbi:PREDICTED: uncharacterized protein LOC107336715 [Acropora digitifera]|uniref:uncharacterized protein LOC107336715 n=1 Tax=Acropora digitifera TaxID=70779 RepID=UPI00077A0C9F|nr:PREDICTED: uncharacterized protein LOC107336715 [Acropora digitifera]